MSKRSNKHVQKVGGGVAVMERPAAEKAVNVKRAKRLARLQPKVDAPVTEPSVVAAVAAAIKHTQVTTANLAPAIEVDGMIATSYYRDKHSPMAGTFGALVQEPSMKGTLRGRWCRHSHATSAEAVACAKATITAKAA
jgi:hypothetical protein